MCDYSLMHVKSRDAVAGETLVSSAFAASISHGFASPEDCNTAVCVRPGTELGFEKEPTTRTRTFFQMVFGWQPKYKVATFRQINLDQAYTHHDALEFEDGSVVMLHNLDVGLKAVVLQMPAVPKTETEAKSQERLEIVG